ncbi:hypothetical protein BC939DRAFT_473973 [Gamsiella multidivaricata]|uniref:uncharacterized protein n=1 Tax=Gamsiella multidivaricata TaxID=101098 RepID=UPI00221FCCBC|nr:uncharacterized protein BC939DRAFT_473973 [Gamsiella multidivaricata]KAI7829773.1 hypothetical protein BC939DRAFT_473973 [Gamsiella multidivaricata]
MSTRPPTTHALEINEILFLVGNFIQQADLKSCSLVSRRWHLIFASHYWWTILMDFSALHERKFSTYENIKLGRLEQLHYEESKQPSLHIDYAKEGRRMDKEFYRALCDAALRRAQKVDCVLSKEIAMESFLGLMLLAGRRYDLRRLIFVKHYDVANMEQHLIQVPSSALPDGTPANDTEEFLSLGPTTQEAVDLAVRIIEQNRDLEVLRFGEFLPELDCTLHGDFLRILLLNAPVLERLWVQNIVCDTRLVTVLPLSLEYHYDSSSGLSIIGVNVGLKLKTLGICSVIGLPLSYQLQIAKQFPNLESLTLTLVRTCDITLNHLASSASSPPPSTSSSFGATNINGTGEPTIAFQPLHKLNLIFPQVASNNNGDPTAPSTYRIAHILASLPSTQLHDLSIYASEFQLGDFTKLLRLHAQWLQNIEIENSTGVSGMEILSLLQVCPSLRKLHAPSVQIEYFKTPYDLQQEWVCGATLQSLTISVECSSTVEKSIVAAIDAWSSGASYACVHFSSHGDNAHNIHSEPPCLIRQFQFLDKLATLTRLQNLNLVCSKEGTCLELSLKTGLGRLAPLKQLQVLDVRTREERDAVAAAVAQTASHGQRQRTAAWLCREAISKAEKKKIGMITADVQENDKWITECWNKKNREEKTYYAEALMNWRTEKKPRGENSPSTMSIYMLRAASGAAADAVASGAAADAVASAAVGGADELLAGTLAVVAVVAVHVSGKQGSSSGNSAAVPVATIRRWLRPLWHTETDSPLTSRQQHGAKGDRPVLEINPHSQFLQMNVGAAAMVPVAVGEIVPGMIVGIHTMIHVGRAHAVAMCPQRKMTDNDRSGCCRCGERVAEVRSTSPEYGDDEADVRGTMTGTLSDKPAAPDDGDDDGADNGDDDPLSLGDSIAFFIDVAVGNEICCGYRC